MFVVDADQSALADCPGLDSDTPAPGTPEHEGSSTSYLSFTVGTREDISITH